MTADGISHRYIVARDNQGCFKQYENLETVYIPLTNVYDIVFDTNKLKR